METEERVYEWYPQAAPLDLPLGADIVEWQKGYLILCEREREGQQAEMENRERAYAWYPQAAPLDDIDDSIDMSDPDAEPICRVTSELGN
ncbi:uncharacterized protein N7515_002422 [Penicillium bovifimosum]|uniref:Uncharacterized protein n=1 Tax=Penicillium bovifimosum TaxID=126998 RepID=A0A9W9HC76_9EURO|nr:uncharacterized protein N7515_002422 [Penicillium bovifimosum]KAJ5143635.1 hypothetical protein N7515_002422 [Penicillium bovifimosum]